MCRTANAKVAFQLLIDVDEAWRRPDSIGHGETQPVSLARSMIGILAKDDDTNFIKRREVERSKPVGSGGEDPLSGIALGQQEMFQVRHIILHELALQRLEPAWV